LVAALETAWPFAGAWLLAAPLCGAFARAAFRSPAAAALAVIGSWLPAWLVALLLRAALQRRAIPISFDLVALLTNLLLLAGWRAGLSALLGRRSEQ
jgi:hypothetical protein